jgi:hypothetical protein
MADVECSVSNCFFWGVGDLCQADRIRVRANARIAQRTPRLDAAGMFVIPQDSPNESRPRSSWETECQTFRPHDGGPARGDAPPHARANR